MFSWNEYCMPVYNFFWKNGECSKGELFLLWTQEETVILDVTLFSTIVIPKENLFAASREFLENHYYQGDVLGMGLVGTLVTDFISTFSENSLITNIDQYSFFELYEGEASLEDVKKSVLVYEVLCKISLAERGEKEIYSSLVVAAIEEIHLNYRGIFGIEELANTLVVSKSHLIRSFQKATGITPGKYLVKVRLESAKRALQQNLSLDVVAKMNGFSSAGYFCKVFKKEMGETPIQWKNKNRFHIMLKAKDVFEEELLLYL